jgi:hypothetical protein
MKKKIIMPKRQISPMPFMLMKKKTPDKANAKISIVHTYSNSTIKANK